MTTLDIRWPLGLIFALVGMILIGYGTWGTLPNPGAGAIDRAWGGVLLLFGAVMVWLARRAARGAHA